MALSFLTFSYCETSVTARRRLNNVDISTIMTHIIGVTAGQDVLLWSDQVSSRAGVWVSGCSVHVCECRGTCQGCEGVRCEDWEPPILSPVIGIIEIMSRHEH